MSKNKIICIVIIIVIVLIIAVGCAYWYMHEQNSYFYTNNSAANTQNNNAPVNTSTQNNPTQNNNPASSGSSLSYSNALKIYAGKRIQFSVNPSNYCLMNPSSAIFKKGTSIMLDNRSSKALTISLDAQPYYIKAYGFKIIALTTSTTLPHTIKVDCGTGKNNGSITLEK